MDAKGVKGKGLIHAATARTRTALEQCQLQPELMKHQWAENRLADFTLWDSGIGASANEKVSLDYRLASQPETQDVVLSLLRALAAEADRCTQRVTFRKDSDVEDETSQKEIRRQNGTLISQTAEPFDVPTPGYQEPTSQSAMYQFDVTLDRLLRVSMAIRKSGAQHRLARADRSFDRLEHQDLYAHLCMVLFVRKDMTEQQMDHIQARLLEANVRRRHRFLYAQRHAKNLAGIPENIHSPGIFFQRHPRAIYQVVVMMLLHIVLFAKFLWLAHLWYFRSFFRTTGHPLSYSELKLSHAREEGTVATRVTNLRGSKKVQTPSQGALSSMSITASRVEWPNPPKIREDAMAFRCPCCCQTLPISSHATGQWVKHLDEDLRPFTCIIPNCAKAMTLYSTKDDWQKHILEDHVSEEYWICPLCPQIQYHGSQPFANAARFPDRADFEKHLLGAHKGAMSTKGAISANLTSTLVETSKRSTPVDLNECPMCHITDGPIKLDKHALLDHIAVELRELALRSLPWYDTSPEIEGSTKAAGADAAVWKWLDGVEPPGDKGDSSAVEYKGTGASPTSESLRAQLPTETHIERATRFLRQVEDSEGFPALLHQAPSAIEENQYYDLNDYFAVDEIRSGGADNSSEGSLSERSVWTSEGSPDPVRATLEATGAEQSDDSNEDTATDHTSTLESVENPGVIDRDPDVLVLQRDLASREKALGPNHPSTLDTVNNLGDAYRLQGKLNEAEELYQHALAGREKALRADHPSTLDTVRSLGNTYRLQGRLKEAEAMFDRVQAGEEVGTYVVRLISSTIATIEASLELYESIRDATNLPKAFREVAQTIPLVLSILRTYQQRAQEERERTNRNFNGRVELEQALERVKTIMENCQEKALALKEIFEKVLPGKDDAASSLMRYRMAIKSVMPGREKKVEDLMNQILECMQLLNASPIFGGEHQEGAGYIEAAIEEFSKLEPSLPTDDDDGRADHYGSRPQDRVQSGDGVQTSRGQISNSKQYDRRPENFGKDEDEDDD